MMVSMVLGYALLFAGIAIFAQGWRELYRARKLPAPRCHPTLGRWAHRGDEP